MVLGPSSSRLVAASSVFVQQVQVTDNYSKGVFLYSFSEKPELSFETNWSSSNYLIIGSYSRKVANKKIEYLLDFKYLVSEFSMFLYL